MWEFVSTGIRAQVASSPDYAKYFLQIWNTCGPFVAGVAFGSGFTSFQHWLASRERAQRSKIELEREQELNKQLNIKDEIINKMHDREREMLEEKTKKKEVKTK